MNNNNLESKLCKKFPPITALESSSKMTLNEKEILDIKLSKCQKSKRRVPRQRLLMLADQTPQSLDNTFRKCRHGSSVNAKRLKLDSKKDLYKPQVTKETVMMKQNPIEIEKNQNDILAADISIVSKNDSKKSLSTATLQSDMLAHCNKNSKEQIKTNFSADVAILCSNINNDQIVENNSFILSEVNQDYAYTFKPIIKDVKSVQFENMMESTPLNISFLTNCTEGVHTNLQISDLSAFQSRAKSGKKNGPLKLNKKVSKPIRKILPKKYESKNTNNNSVGTFSQTLDTATATQEPKLYETQELHIIKSLVDDSTHFELIYENLRLFCTKPNQFYKQFGDKHYTRLSNEACKLMIRTLANFVNKKTLSHLRENKFSYFFDVHRGFLIVRFISSFDTVEEQFLLTDHIMTYGSPEEYLKSEGIPLENALFSNTRGNVSKKVFPLAFPSISTLLNKISTCNSFKTYCCLLSNLSLLYFYNKDFFNKIQGSHILFNAKFENIDVFNFIKEHTDSLHLVTKQVHETEGIEAAFKAYKASSSFSTSTTLEQNVCFLADFTDNLRFALAHNSQQAILEVAVEFTTRIYRVQKDNKTDDDFYSIMQIYLDEIKKDLYFKGRENMTPYLNLFDPHKVSLLSVDDIHKFWVVCKGIEATPHQIVVSLKEFCNTLQRLQNETLSELPIWFRVIEEFNSNLALKNYYPFLYEIYRRIGLLSIEPTSLNLLNVLYLRKHYLDDQAQIPEEIFSKLFFLEVAGPRLNRDNVWDYLTM